MSLTTPAFALRRMPAGGARAAADDDEDGARAAGDEEEEEEDHNEDAEGEGSGASPKPTRADKNALSSLVPNATGWHLMRMAEGVLQPAEEVSTKLEHEGKKRPYITRPAVTRASKASFSRDGSTKAAPFSTRRTSTSEATKAPRK